MLNLDRNVTYLNSIEVSPKLKPPQEAGIGENSIEYARSGPSWSATTGQRGQAKAGKRGPDAGDQ